MTQTTSEYEKSRTRAERKRKFRGDVVAYIVINAFLIGVWAVTGSGYFWPGWVLAGWGVFLLLATAGGGRRRRSGRRHIAGHV